MNKYLLLAISMIACLMGGIFRKYSGNRFKNKQAMYHGFNACVSVVCAVSLFVVSGGIKGASLFTILLGTGFGIITALQTIFTLKAYENGPFSYTSVIISLSTIIPTLSGYFFWGESIAEIQIAGIILMLVSFVCSVDFKGETKKSSIIWIVCAMVAFICTGFIGVMQKIHQTSIYKDELDIFLIIAFVISFVYSCVSYMIIRNKQKKSQETYGKDFGVVLLVIMVISGICVAVNNKVNLDLSGKIPSVIFFPVVNGGGLILSTLASVIIFREKLSCKKWAGIFVGILAVVLLCNPFK